jgi:hypothetical protein
VPLKGSLSEADYESDVLLVRLNTTWIEAYQTSLPQIVLQSTRRTLSQSFYEQDIATFCH